MKDKGSMKRDLFRNGEHRTGPTIIGASVGETGKRPWVKALWGQCASEYEPNWNIRQIVKFGLQRGSSLEISAISVGSKKGRKDHHRCSGQLGSIDCPWWWRVPEQLIYNLWQILAIISACWRSLVRMIGKKCFISVMSLGTDTTEVQQSFLF